MEIQEHYPSFSLSLSLCLSLSVSVLHSVARYSTKRCPVATRNITRLLFRFVRCTRILAMLLVIYIVSFSVPRFLNDRQIFLDGCVPVRVSSLRMSRNSWITCRLYRPHFYYFSFFFLHLFLQFSSSVASARLFLCDCLTSSIQFWRAKVGHAEMSLVTPLMDEEPNEVSLVIISISVRYVYRKEARKT